MGKYFHRRFFRGRHKNSFPGLALLILASFLPLGAATFTVTDTSDSSSDPGSLRYALLNAASGDTINFQNNLGTITLTTALPAITQNLTINGGTGNTISGNDSVQVLFVNSGTVGINNLTIANGKAQGGAGGSGGGGGAAGMGGGLLVNSTANVTLSGVRFSSNSAVGGAGGIGSGVVAGGGGGVGGAGGDGNPLGDGYFVHTGGTGGNGGIFGGTGGTGGTDQGSGSSGTGLGAGGGGGGADARGDGGGGGNGTFGGGGGGTGGFGGQFVSAGAGGFGGGGGGAIRASGAGGFGGGNGTYFSGGGGAGLGGAIFVVSGGQFMINSGTISGNAVAGGAGGYPIANGGSAYGSGLFLNGNGTLYFAPGTSQAVTISDDIADQTGNGGTGANAGSWGVTANGTGTVTLSGNNSYSGGTTLNNGTLVLGNNSALGTGGLTISYAASPSSSNNNNGSSGSSSGSGSNSNSGGGGSNSGSTGSEGNGGVTINTGGGSLEISGGATLGLVSGGAELISTGAFIGYYSNPTLNNGTLVLSGVNTYSGGTTINNGTLLLTGVSSLSGLSTAGTETVTGTLAYSGTFTTVNVTLTSGSTTTYDPTVVYQNGITISNPITITGTLTATTLEVDNSDLATQSGVIGESGSSEAVTKAGTGTLILTGANTYSGGTTINAGTLMIGNSTALGTGDLTVNAGTLDLNGYNIQVANLSGAGGTITSSTGTGTLTLNETMDPVFAGSITGPMAVTYNGTNASNLILLGSSTYTGGTTINGGTIVAGSTTAFGTGNLALQGGTLTVGVTPSGTLHIGGNYVQGPGGTLSFTISSPTVYNSLTIGGTAQLGGTLVVNFQSGFSPGSGETFNLITAAGGITGQFSSVVDNLPTLRFSLNGGGLSIQQLAFASFAQTLNQVSVASYIDAHDLGAMTPGFSNLVAALNSVSGNTQTLTAAFDQLTPLKFASFTSTTSFNNASFYVQQLDSYLANHRGADGTFVGSDGNIDYSGLAVNDPQIDPGLQSVRSRLLAWSPAPGLGLLSDSGDTILGGIDPRDSKDILAPGPANLWNVFISGNVILAQDFSDPSAGLAGANSTTGAVQVGLDYKITSHWLVGGTFAYGHTSATLDTIGSNANVNTYSPGVYASYSDNGWYANGLASYGFANYNQDRNVAIGAFNGTAHSAPRGDQIVGDLDGGYDFHRGPWTFGPTAGLQYVHLNVDGYSESGLPGANLTVGSSQADSLRSLLGGRLTYAVHDGGLIFTPHLSASWQHEYLNQSRGITSQFSDVGAGSFVVNTPNPSSNSALAELGLDAQLNNALTIFADYTVQAGQSNYFGQSVQAGFKIGF